MIFNKLGAENGETKTQNSSGLCSCIGRSSEENSETIESQLDAIQTYAKTNNYYIEKDWIFKRRSRNRKIFRWNALDCLRDLVREGGPI